MTIPVLTFWGFKSVEELCKVKKLERGGENNPPKKSKHEIRVLEATLM